MGRSKLKPGIVELFGNYVLISNITKFNALLPLTTLKLHTTYGAEQNHENELDGEIRQHHQKLVIPQSPEAS